VSNCIDCGNVQVFFGGYRLEGIYFRKLPRIRRRVTVPEIQAAVADHYHLPIACMTSPDRHREVCYPRQLAMYLCRDLIGRSLPDIGRRFGGRDHTTVLHAVRAVSKRLASDYEVRDAVCDIRKRLGG